jgi:glycosyltransferase involved in cell wall biosynthesis
MERVCVGIIAQVQPQQLRATLESVRRNMAPGARLVLLPDGPETGMREELRALADVPQFGTDEPRGGPACFNRLVASGGADVFVLLEGGAVVGPGWLDYLLAALGAGPRNGLAGPSTNRSWNEQGAFPGAGGSPEEVAATAREAARRFGTATRTLGPLYSLADFCYSVRREVVAAVGPADEGYGTGPCWEMDYNVRAARAGFRGVWACGAYVYRPPPSDRRRRAEADGFEASKHRYQDKFCGRRLRGERGPYRPHCRGDACPNFAPAALLTVGVAPAPAPPAVVPRAPAVAAAPDEPLLSCIMPTYNRRAYVPLAVRYFLRQDYPRAELVVVDDGSDPVADCLPDDSRVRYVRLDRRLTIGAKRNLACAEARGDVIVHWDDDDWYPPWRLRVQSAALQERGAEVCGSSQVFYFDAAAGRAWRYHYTGAPGSWVVGGTLAYRKGYWARNPFPDLQVGEDTRFLWGGRPKGLCDLGEPALCVAMIHAANSSPKVTAGCYWQPYPEAQLRELLGDDWAAYRAPPDRPPLVSCVMPTYNRRPFVPLALRAFRAQDYPNKELLVIDDGTDPVGDLIEGEPGVRYVRLASRTSIGRKRNLACDQAAGAFIAHWDDDDWYAPARLRYQVGPLLAGTADITGLENAFVLELPGGVFWATQPALHRRMFVGDVHGGTLVYRKSLWEGGVRYPDADLAEDAALLSQALRRGGRLTRLDNPGVFVYVRHGNNAWRFETGRFLDPCGWLRTGPPATFPDVTLATYQAAATGTGGAGRLSGAARARAR